MKKTRFDKCRKVLSVLIEGDNYQEEWFWLFWCIDKFSLRCEVRLHFESWWSGLALRNLPPCSIPGAHRKRWSVRRVPPSCPEVWAAISWCWTKEMLHPWSILFSKEMKFHWLLGFTYPLFYFIVRFNFISLILWCLGENTYNAD